MKARRKHPSAKAEQFNQGLIEMQEDYIKKFKPAIKSASEQSCSNSSSQSALTFEFTKSLSRAVNQRTNASSIDLVIERNNKIVAHADYEQVQTTAPMKEYCRPLKNPDHNNSKYHAKDGEMRALSLVEGMKNSLQEGDIVHFFGPKGSCPDCQNQSTRFFARELDKKNISLNLEWTGKKFMPNQRKTPNLSPDYGHPDAKTLEAPGGIRVNRLEVQKDLEILRKRPITSVPSDDAPAANLCILS